MSPRRSNSLKLPSALVPCVIEIRHKDFHYSPRIMGMVSRCKSLKALTSDFVRPASQFYVNVCSEDQVHVVKQGVLGLHLDSSSHKLKRPKKLSSRWTVLTRCEKTGQHTLHICKTDSPDSSVKDSFPVQTSWSIKSAHCLKTSQRMDIFKEEGFIIHMGRQVVYITCSTRSEVKSWMCAVLEGVTLGFEYHCKVGENRTLGVAGECMLVLSPECMALLCPLTGAPLRKWPFFLLTRCSVVDDSLCWETSDSEHPVRVTVNKHNVFTLYNVLCRYLSHTNTSVQVDISVSKPDPQAHQSRPAENKYTTREPIPPAAASSPDGLRDNQLYLSQDSCSEKLAYELLSSNHSDYSTGVSSVGSAYDSDIYELMENSGIVTDCIYEDMSATSPQNDEGYMTSSSRSMPPSSHPRLRITSSRGAAGKSKALQHPPLSVYMNMESKTRHPEATPSEQTREHITCDVSPNSRDQLAPREPSRDHQLSRHTSDDDQLSRELSRDDQLSRQTSTEDSSPTVRTPNYEYIDIEFPPPDSIRQLSSPSPPQLPNRNKPDQFAIAGRYPNFDIPTSVSRDKLAEGLKSYQEQVRLQKEMMVNFSAAVLESNSIDPLSSGNATRTFMNSTV